MKWYLKRKTNFDACNSKSINQFLLSNNRVKTLTMTLATLPRRLGFFLILEDLIFVDRTTSRIASKAEPSALDSLKKHYPVLFISEAANEKKKEEGQPDDHSDSDTGRETTSAVEPD